MNQDPIEVWESLAAGGVRVIDITGRHATMLNRPQVETLARLIKDCLMQQAISATASQNLSISQEIR